MVVLPQGVALINKIIL